MGSSDLDRRSPPSGQPRPRCAGSRSVPTAGRYSTARPTGSPASTPQPARYSTPSPLPPHLARQQNTAPVTWLTELRQFSKHAKPDQIDHLTLTGLALLGCFLCWPTDDPRWEQPPPEWDPSIEALAAAMSVRADPAAIRDEALDHAIGLVLTTVHQ